MRKSKYDQSPLPVQGSKCIDVNLTNQIKDIKDVIQELRQIKAFVDASVLTFEESAQVLNAAVKTFDNISDTICHAIIQTENTVINVKLSDEDKAVLAEYRHRLIEKQITELKALHTNHWKEVYKYVKSDTSFSLNGRIAKCAIVGFWILYAYFCLTLGGLIIYMKFF